LSYFIGIDDGTLLVTVPCDNGGDDGEIGLVMTIVGGSNAAAVEIAIMVFMVVVKTLVMINAEGDVHKRGEAAGDANGSGADVVIVKTISGVIRNNLLPSSLINLSVCPSAVP